MSNGCRLVASDTRMYDPIASRIEMPFTYCPLIGNSFA